MGSQRRRKAIPGSQAHEVRLDRSDVLAMVGLFVSSTLVFFPASSFSFINWDDPLYVVDNPFIRRGISIEFLKWAFGSFWSANWHPVTWISHAIDCTLFGVAPFGHHLTSVLLHSVNAVLLYWVLRLATGMFIPSVLTALIFAIHPLRVESVAWVSERKDLLSGLFFILTIWAYSSWLQERRRRAYVALLATFALGLMSKQTLVCLPVLLLWLDIWPFRRAENLHHRLLEKIPLLLLALAASVIAYAAQQSDGAVMELAQMNWPSRLANAFVSYCTYVLTFFCPIGLAAFYPLPAVALSFWVVGPAVLFVIGISVLTFFYRSRHPEIFVGWYWFLICLLPVIGIVQVGSQARADRYTYLSGIGLAVCVSWGVSGFLKYRRYSLGLAFGIGLWLVMLTASTVLVLPRWKNSETLWTSTLANTKNNSVAHNNLGNEFARQGRLKEAVSEFRESLKIEPGQFRARNNLGGALMMLGDLALAERFFREAISLSPEFSDAHANLGSVLAGRGETRAGIEELAKAIELDRRRFKEKPLTHFKMGLALEQLGEGKRAIPYFHRALELDPGDKGALAGLRRVQEAER